VRDPITKTYAIRLDHKYYDEVISGWESKGYVQLNEDALLWTPYIMGRSNQSHFDRAPMHAVAQRDDADEDEEVEDEDAPMVNGSGPNALDEPAGPPSTIGLQPYGAHHHAAGHSDLPPINPAAGIPPSRFELWPPVLAAAPKRKPGRPFGSTKKDNYRASLTPSAARNSGRNTPRRPSALAMFTPGSNVRRGRSSIVAESPAADATPTHINALGLEQGQVVEEEAVLDDDIDADGEVDDIVPVPEANATVENELANGDTLSGEPPKTNGIKSPKVPENSGPLKTPEKKIKHPSRSPETAISLRSHRSNDNPKTPRSVNRKALVEKVQVMVPAEPGSASKSEGKGEGAKAVNTNGIEADSDADADAEYEVDGDIVMQT
jgi:histone acetyltransferase SAS3